MREGNLLTLYAEELEVFAGNRGSDEELYIKLSSIAMALKGIAAKYDEEDRLLKSTEQDFTDVIAYLTAIINNITDGMLVIDVNGVIIQFNPSLLQMFDLNHTELIAKGCKDVFPVEIVNLIDKVLKEREGISEGELLLPGGRVGKAVVSGIYKSGYTVDVNAASEFIGAVLTIHDYTERKAIEDRLAQTLQEQKIILESASIGIIAVKERKVVWTNDSFLSISGFLRDDIIGRDTMRFYPSSEVYEEVGRQAYGIMASGGTFQTELKMRRADDNLYWASLRGKAIDPKEPLEGSIWLAEEITARKEAERILIESEAKFRSMFEDHSAIMAIIDPDDMRVVDVNGAAVKFYGYTKEEFIQKSVYDIYVCQTEGCPDKFQDGRLYFHDSQSTPFTFWTRLSNGEIKVIEIRATPIPVNERTLMFAVINDITERVNAESALKDSEEKMRSLMNNLSVGIFRSTVAGGGRITQANRAAAEILGYDSVEEVMKCTVTDFYNNPKDRAGLLHEIITNGQIRNMELRFKKKDGTPIWAYISAIGHFENGELLWLDGFIDDITQTKLIQDRLLESEKKYRDLVESANSIIMRWDVSGKITFFNKFALDFFGYTEDSLKGRHVIGTILPEKMGNISFLKSITRDMVAHPDRYKNYDLESKRKDGKTVWISWINKVIYDDDSGNYEFLSIGMDITDRKRAEELLIIAKLAAEEANRSKSSFLANMSHEIRTPMNAIIGLTSLCLQTDVSLKQKDYLDKIDASSRALLSIINDILDFSKIEAGKLDLEAIEFNLDDVLHNLSTMITFKADQKNLEFLFITDPDVPMTLVGDPLRLGQILVNLASNAVKFTEKGEIIVLVKTVQIDQSTATLKFIVRDSGIGLNKEQLNLLFQPFSQADNSTTRKYGGTGLGLTICKRLINLMNGEITVESVLGRGSSFIFTAMFGYPEGMRKERKRDVPDVGHLRVMLLDDNRIARNAIRNILKSFSFDVQTASTGSSALSIIERSVGIQPFGLIILDSKMPGMDGVEVLRKIRGNPMTRGIPVIMMITSDKRGLMADIEKDLYIEAYLEKPVSQSSLFNAIMQAFGKTGGRVLRPDTGLGVLAYAGLNGKRVLLVEDNEINQQVATEIMNKAGISVDIAGNGCIGVEKASAIDYDAILMDIQMPEMDGYTATRTIKGNTKSRAPIIAMTANAMSGDRERSLEAGMNDHIAKPVDPKELFNVLCKWMNAAPGLSTSDVDKCREVMEEMPGLNIRSGLKRAMSDTKFYREILGRFYENYSDVIEKIRSAYMNKDVGLAQRISHTLKGVSGTIGADGLFNAMKLLDAALKSGDRDIPSLIDSADSELKIVLSSIKGHILTDNGGQSEGGSEKVAPNIEELSPILQKIYVMLMENDAECVEYIDKELASTGFFTGHEDLFKSIKGYDFDGAIEQLKKIAGDLDVVLEGGIQ